MTSHVTDQRRPCKPQGTNSSFRSVGHNTSRTVCVANSAGFLIKDIQHFSAVTFFLTQGLSSFIPIPPSAGSHLTAVHIGLVDRNMAWFASLA